MDSDDAATLGLAAGDRVRLRSATGSFEGRVHLARLPEGTLQVHWPEGNVLVPTGAAHREPASKVPDYSAVVTVSPA
jgi:anaerobic selenocysteine-containing dehydrogenase